MDKNTEEKALVKTTEESVPIPTNNNDTDPVAIKIFPSQFGATIVHTPVNVPLRRPPPVVFVKKEFILPAKRPNLFTLTWPGIKATLRQEHVPKHLRSSRTVGVTRVLVWCVILFGGYKIAKELKQTIKDEWASMNGEHVVFKHRRTREEVDWANVFHPGLRDRALKVMREREAAAAANSKPKSFF